MSEHRGRAAITVIGSGLLFGTTGTATVLADTGASSLAIAAGRLLVGSLGLFAVASYRHGWRNVLALWRERDTWLMALGAAGYMAFFFLSVQVGGVAIASLVSISLAPFFAASLARALGRAWPGHTWLVSTVLALGGVALLGWPTTGIDGDHRLLGALIAAAASLAYAAYTVFGAHYVERRVPATMSLAASFSLGSLFLLPFLATDVAWLGTGHGLTLVLWLGLASTTTAYLMFGYGITHLAPGIVATLVLSEPVVATLLGVGVLGEAMPVRGWIGCVMIVLQMEREPRKCEAHAR